MRITELTAYHVRIALKKRVRHASFARDETDSIVVRCVLDTGAVGWGEGLPRPYVTGETVETALAQLASVCMEPLRLPFASLREAVAMCGQIRLGEPPGGLPEAFRDRGCFGNSARCALEIAVLDAACRSVGEPLSAVTSLVPETAGIREFRPEVRYSAVLTAETPLRRWVSLWKYRLYGFTQVKVKVGVSGIDDVELLRRVRNILGNDVELRLDANEAWTCEELPSRIERLMEFRPVSVEQPVPHAEADGLAKLRVRLPIPVMFDESLCCEEDARRAIERGTCGLFNLRLSKCGGFVPTLRLAAMAHRAGLGYQLGCQVGETGILSAAGRHFASSVAGIRALEGSYDRHLVRERLTAEDITFGRGGRASALGGPGLGVQIDSRAIDRVTVRKAPFLPHPDVAVSAMR